MMAAAERREQLQWGWHAVARPPALQLHVSCMLPQPQVRDLLISPWTELQDNT